MFDHGYYFNIRTASQKNIQYITVTWRPDSSGNAGWRWILPELVLNYWVETNTIKYPEGSVLHKLPLDITLSKTPLGKLDYEVKKKKTVIEKHVPGQQISLLQGSCLV